MLLGFSKLCLLKSELPAQALTMQPAWPSGRNEGNKPTPLQLLIACHQASPCLEEAGKVEVGGCHILAGDLGRAGGW